jgi:hypothetical protein
MSSPLEAPLPLAPALPAEGVVRLAWDPAALPEPGDEAGPNRYDDPRPRTLDRYVMRYTARRVLGSVLELLDHLRPPHHDAVAREADVDDNDDHTDLHDGHPAPGGQAEPWQPLRDFLTGRMVGILRVGPSARVVSVNDPEAQAVLNEATAVRALLDSDDGRAALLPARADDRQVQLDGAAVRLSTEFGRDLTQAISLDLRDRTPGTDVIHYRSRHDDAEDCWAIYDHTDVEVLDVRPFSPDHPDDLAAVRRAAALWGLVLPPEWRP